MSNREIKNLLEKICLYLNALDEKKRFLCSDDRENLAAATKMLQEIKQHVNSRADIL